MRSRRRYPLTFLCSLEMAFCDQLNANDTGRVEMLHNYSAGVDFDIIVKHNSDEPHMDKDYLQNHLGELEEGYLQKRHEREEGLSVIKRAGEIIASTSDIPGVFESFVEELRQLVDVSWAAITLALDKDLYFLALSSKIGSPWQVGELIPIEGTGTEWVLTHKIALVESDLSQESKFVTGTQYLKQGIRSIAYLPLIAIDSTIGNLTVASCEPNAYSQVHTVLLEQLASQIAVPIKHSRLYAEVRQKVKLDEVTGLSNRRYLEEAIAKEISRHTRYGGVFSLIILGLESFEAFNDKYGNQVADDLLREIGSSIKNMTRHADQAFRYGEDKFAILLPNTSPDAANRVSERLRNQIVSAMTARDIQITAYFGLVSWPINALVANELIDAANAALHGSKRNSVNPGQGAPSTSLPPGHEKVSSVDSQDDKVLNSIYALAAIVDARNYYNSNHWRKVKEYVTVLAKGLNMRPEDVERLQTCALFHDIGKISVSDKIIDKRDRLTKVEWEVIKAHPQVGANIVSHARQLASCIPGILHHHERYNGSGYPAGLQGDHIPLDARIMAIADAFAAMTSDRSYGDALTRQAAIEEIKKGAGTQFDPHLVEVFVSNIGQISLTVTGETTR